MIYHFSLRTAGWIAGIVLLLLGALGFSPARRTLPRFPRSRSGGVVLLTLDLVWSWWLIATMEMGEFSSFRRPLLILLPVGYFLVLRFVDEFLSVRALGIFCLLAAEPLLDAAFLRPEMSRLLVTVLAYALIIAGLLWAGSPYLLRDQVSWAEKSPARWGCISALALLYGAALILCALLAY